MSVVPKLSEVHSHCRGMQQGMEFESKRLVSVHLQKGSLGTTVVCIERLETVRHKHV